MSAMLTGRFVAWSLLVLTSFYATTLRSSTASTPTPPSTPFAIPVARSCVSNLERADIVIELEIGKDVPANQHELIEWIVDSRVHAMGIYSCSVDRSGQRIVIAMLTNLTLTSAEFEELLTAPGRIELIDPGEDTLAVGDRVQTSSIGSISDATPTAEPVYEVIVSNADFLSVTPLISVLEEPYARFELTKGGHRRLAGFTSTRAGQTLPFVLDGVVVLAPTIYEPLQASFDLHPANHELIQKLAVYAAALPYPAPLTMTGFVDLRAS